MKKNILISAASALLLAAAVVPARASDCPGFLPPNDMRIPVDSPEARGITEAQFNGVLDTIQRLYGPIVAQQGGVLQINRRWTDATVNASAQQSGNKFILNMYGGLARHDAITMDGFALVVCHELGHHLGGAPKSGGWFNSWASIEGQSDYYANLKCLRKVFADPGAAAFTADKDDDQVAVEACETAFASSLDRDICIRGTKAGKSVAALFMDLHHETTPPLFATPDQNVVSTMFESHPATQCRLDTYLQGSICPQPVSAALSNTDPAAGTCTRSGGFSFGFRPLCWYKPAKASELADAAPAEAPAFRAGPAFSALRDGFNW